MSAGDMQAFHRITETLHRIEHMAGAKRNGHGGAPVKTAETVERRIQSQPADNADGMWIGKRRAVAVEIRQHMQPLGEGLALKRAQLRYPRNDAGMQRRIRLTACRMHAHDMVEQRTGGRLPAFHQPVPGQDRLPIGPPEAVAGHLPLRHGDKAARSPGDQGHMPADICRQAAAKRAKRAGIGVDHARRHLTAGIETELGGSFGRKRADAFPRHHGGFGKACPLLQVGKARQFQIIRLPAGIFLCQEIPLRRLRAI
ncbi:hypothetical protein D3C87_1260850 [compost metagenome]